MTELDEVVPQESRRGLAQGDDPVEAAGVWPRGTTRSNPPLPWRIFTESVVKSTS